MRWIDNINKWSFGITLLLYLTIFWGLIAQLALGSIQVLLSIILIYNWKNYNPRSKSLLISYWVLATVYGILFFLTDIPNSYFIIFLMITPMCIAGYFVYITHSLSKQYVYIFKTSDQ